MLVVSVSSLGRRKDGPNTIDKLCVLMNVFSTWCDNSLKYLNMNFKNFLFQSGNCLRIVLMPLNMTSWSSPFSSDNWMSGGNRWNGIGDSSKSLKNILRVDAMVWLSNGEKSIFSIFCASNSSNCADNFFVSLDWPEIRNIYVFIYLFILIYFFEEEVGSSSSYPLRSPQSFTCNINSPQSSPTSNIWREERQQRSWKWTLKRASFRKEKWRESRDRWERDIQ